MYLVEKLKEYSHFQLNQYGFLRYFKWLKEILKKFLTFELVLLLLLGLLC